MPILTCLAAAAFAGLLLWTGALASPAKATEAATAIAAPAARAGEADGCRIVAPRFAPNAHARGPATEVNFLGGAKLRFPVATPCPHQDQGFDA